MRLPCKTYQEAVTYALQKSSEDLTVTWYINRLASSGMKYEVSTKPITNTSFGGGVVATIINNKLLG